MFVIPLLALNLILNVQQLTLTQQIKEIDLKLFYFINHGLKSGIMDYVMIFFTLLGNSLVIIMLTAVILYLYSKVSFKSNFILFLLIIIVGGILTHVLKIAIDRPRPPKELADVNILLTPLYEKSFPSGHAQIAFTTMTYLVKKIKKMAILLITVAMLIGLSRIYVGVHYPTDVLFGSIIGLFVALIGLKIFGRLAQHG